MKNTLLMILVCGVLTNAGVAQISSKPVLIQKQVKLPTTLDASKILTRERAQMKQLSQADKLAVVNDALKQQGVKTTANSFALPVKLSALNPKANAENFLGYVKPLTVLTDGDRATFGNAAGWNESSLIVSYKPPAPGFYLFDFGVRKAGNSAFTLFTLDGKIVQTQKYAAGPLSYDRVTFTVNFTEAKQQTVFLFSDSIWSFYECEISQIK